MLSSFWKRVSLLASIDLEAQTASFFQAFLQLNKNPQVNALIRDIFNNRRDLSDEHLAFLLWVAFQYVTNSSFSEGDGIFDQSNVSNCFQEHTSLIRLLCLNHNVSTNLVRRYAALQIVLSLLQNISATPKTVIDLGCSLGLGLRSLNTPLIRRVMTNENEIDTLLRQQVPVDHLVGLDILDLEKIDWKWMDSCILPYEQSQDGFTTLKDMHNWLLKYGTPIRYFSCNIFDLEQLTSCVGLASADLIWTSNLLYQIDNTPDKALQKMLPVVQILLKPEGIWVNADYIDWDYTFGTEQNQYLIVARLKSNITKTYTIMTSPNDEVPFLEIGKDFAHFSKEIQDQL